MNVSLCCVNSFRQRPCKRPFDSKDSRRHVADSPLHHVCKRCAKRPEFLSEQELDDHTEKVHHGCIDCKLTFDNPGRLSQHNEDEHNMCKTCQKCYDSPSNLGVFFSLGAFGDEDGRISGMEGSPAWTNRLQCWRSVFWNSLAICSP
jgi:hypothetical protein